MSTDITIRSRIKERSAAYLDWLQMLTGLGLVLFMFSHTFLVSSRLMGAEVMNVIARFFEDTGVIFIGGPLIGLTFLLHFYIAARKVPFKTKEQVTIIKHAVMLRHGDTWLWIIQAVTAMAILILGSVHIWTTLTSLPITAARSAERVERLPWLLFYLVLMPVVQLHVGIGIYRIGVKWGFITRANRDICKKIITVAICTLMLISLFTLYIEHR